jgi:hypothetical protein
MRNRLQHVSCGPGPRSGTVKWVVTQLSQPETAAAIGRLPASLTNRRRYNQSCRGSN